MVQVSPKSRPMTLALETTPLLPLDDFKVTKPSSVLVVLVRGPSGLYWGLDFNKLLSQDRETPTPQYKIHSPTYI